MRPIVDRLRCHAADTSLCLYSREEYAEAVHEIERLKSILSGHAELITQCADSLSDWVAIREGRPAAHVGTDRLREIVESARSAAEKARA